MAYQWNQWVFYAYGVMLIVASAEPIEPLVLLVKWTGERLEVPAGRIGQVWVLTRG